MTIALTRLPSPRMAEAELTHLDRVPIDRTLADTQHAAYRAALAEAGAEVITLPALDAHPDCTFVEDVLVSLPEVSVLCRPGATSRQGEVAAIEAHLPADRLVGRITAPGTVDGGDVLLIGRTLYVGLSTRTNAEGIAQMTAIVARFGYATNPVTVPGALHLKTAVTALAPDLLLINPNWIDATALAAFPRLTVDPAEPFAGNSLTVGNTIFMQADHARTAARITAAGFAVRLIDISEFAKAEAGLTCMSVIVRSAAQPYIR
jgi:dimethylargininase